MKSIIRKIREDTYNNVNELSVEKLEEVILYANNQYYNNDKPVLTDNEYDILIDFLRLKNPKSIVLKEIGANVKSSQNKVVLDYHMGSMDKIKPPSNHLERWIKEYESPYVISDKLDGISGLLIYRDDGHINLYTRGNSREGIDISKMIKYFNLPKYEDIEIHGTNNVLAVRGELIMSKSNFNSLSDVKTQRNTTSGIMLSKTINPELVSKVSFVTYEIIDPKMEPISGLKKLSELGFEVVHYDRVSGISYKFLSEYFKIRREDSEYDIDGIIVSDTKKHKRNTTGNPKYAFAFKTDLDEQKAETEVLDVEWNKSKHGVYKPVIIIRSVLISGVDISRVTGFNAKYIMENKIGKGTKVEVIRSGDVIPKISKIIKSTKYKLPTGDWSWSKSGVDIIANDIDSEIEIKNIYNFFVVLGAKGLGLRTIKKLYESGYKTIKEFFEISKEEIMDIEGFKSKSADNIVNAIKKSVIDIEIYELMASSNMLGSGFGIERCKKIVDVYPNILEIKEFRIEEIICIDGFDDIMAEQFIDNYRLFINFYKEIKKYVILNEGRKEIRLNVVFSGFRDKELERELESKGVKVLNTISSKVKYLIVRDDNYEETSKVKKAKKLNIEIIIYDDIYEYIN